MFFEDQLRLSLSVVTIFMPSHRRGHRRVRATVVVGRGAGCLTPSPNLEISLLVCAEVHVHEQMVRHWCEATLS